MWAKVCTSFIFVFVFFLQVGLRGHLLFGRQLKYPGYWNSSKYIHNIFTFLCLVPYV